MTRQKMEARRLQALTLFERSFSQFYIVQRFGVSRTTAHRWYQAWKAGSNLKLRKPKGRPNRLTPSQGAEIRELYLCSIQIGKRLKNRQIREEILRRFAVAYDVDHICRMTKRWRLKTASRTESEAA